MIVVAGIVWSVYRTSFHENLASLSQTGAVRVEQTAERLTDQLDRFRVLSNLLAKDPRIANSMLADADRQAVSDFLRQHVLTYGAARIELLNADGDVVATSDQTVEKISRRGSPLLAAAINGRLGTRHGLEADRRQISFSKGIMPNGAPAIGAILVTADIAALEFEWSVAPEAIGFFDRDGVVFVSNRPAMLLLSDSQAPSQKFQPFPVTQRGTIGGFAVWRLLPGYDLPPEALVLSRDTPQVGMTARGFLDTHPARDAAQLRAMLSAALLALIGLAIMIVAQWRRRLAEKLAIEAASNARLETRVEERTTELRTAQHQLVQATKLTALGQMSAGISHELNQPLAAIMNFSENGVRFLDLGKEQGAKQNFELISGQVTRIDRIIRNLRAFARNEDEPMEPVDVCAILTEALALVENNAHKQAVEIRANATAGPIWVTGGKIRLQQVLVNLLTNAMDAMADGSDKLIHIDLSVRSGVAICAVKDNGPGIVDPTRVFEPFYSTKELGASKGLGLGLSISYGIIGSFGGEISAENHVQGGAEFRITLPILEA